MGMVNLKLHFDRRSLIKLITIKIILKNSDLRNVVHLSLPILPTDQVSKTCRNQYIYCCQVSQTSTKTNYQMLLQVPDCTFIFFVMKKCKMVSSGKVRLQRLFVSVGFTAKRNAT